MKNVKAEELLKQYLEHTATEEERLTIEKWYNSAVDENQDDLPEPNYRIWKSKIAAGLPKAKSAVKLFSWISVAAAFLMMGGLYWFFYNNPPGAERVTFYANDVNPGVNKATLTLADGRKVVLSDVSTGQIAKETGVTITKAADGQLVYAVNASVVGPSGHSKQKALPSYNTLATANGEQYKIILPDGTKLCLNAGSSLKFPTTFTGLDERKVELSGEAYFEVSKDKVHPFVVKSSTQEVKVLGTHFNINSYSDEPTVKTTLLEGSVVVSSLRASSLQASSLLGSAATKQKQATPNITLMPGQQSINTGTSIKVIKADTEEALAWTKGDFVFKEGEDFKSAMRKLARWYNVEIIYDPSLKGEIALGGWFSRKYKISTVLERIESTGNVHFKINGRIITVTN